MKPFRTASVYVSPEGSSLRTNNEAAVNLSTPIEDLSKSSFGVPRENNVDSNNFSVSRKPLAKSNKHSVHEELYGQYQCSIPFAFIVSKSISFSLYQAI